MVDRGINFFLKRLCLFFIASILLFSSFGVNVYSIKSYDEYKYHSYKSMTNSLKILYENNSDIVDMKPIGKTYEGRNIWLMKISDKPLISEDEPAVLLMGALHGNEKPSYESLIFFINYIIELYGSSKIDNDLDGFCDEDDFDGVDNDNDGIIDEDPSEDRITEIIDTTEIFVLPMVNPDGVEYNWRKNHAPNYGAFGTENQITSYGVDLNRNFDGYWYLPYILPFNYMLPFLINDESWNYRGEYPFSENETKAVRDLVFDNPNIRISLSYHSYSEVIMYPWTHTSLNTPDEDLFVSIGENISKINKYRLLKHGWMNRTYLIPRFSGTIGSSENWLYSSHGILSFTMELCKTRVPTNPNVVYDYCIKHVGVNLYIAERSHKLEG